MLPNLLLISPKTTCYWEPKIAFSGSWCLYLALSASASASWSITLRWLLFIFPLFYTHSLPGLQGILNMNIKGTSANMLSVGNR